MEKIKRTEFASFMKTSGASATAVLSRMGKGITGFKLDYGAKTNTEQYIDEDNAVTSVDGYEISADTTMTCYKGEPIFEFIDALRQAHATGSELETDVYLVYIYDATDSTYAAEKYNAVIEIKDFGGDAGNPVELNYNVHLNGDPTSGTATIVDGTLTFTAA